MQVSETTRAIELDDGETRLVRRTTTLPIRNIKADRPHPQLSRPDVKDHLIQNQSIT